ncbi:MAG: right-handed parallel beta-helix repeat-containing protein [Phycisphaerales bacterium]
MSARTRPTRPLTLSLVLATGIGPASLAAADILNVPADFPTIEIAIANAVNGDEIVLAPGTYFQTVDLGTKAISLRAQNPDDPNAPSETIIDAFGLGRCLTIAGGQGSDTLIAGITLRGGVATTDVANGRGGGAVVVNSSPTFRNVVFTENEAVSSGGDGGGAFFQNSASTLTDCLFLDNAADDAGGGAYFRDDTAVALLRCRFESNVSFNGSGIGFLDSNSSVTDCVIDGNGALEGTDDGGGLWINSSNIRLERTVLTGNMTTDDGAALIAYNDSDIVLVNCIVRDNVAGHTAALYAYDDTEISSFHCTIVDNAAAVHAAAFADSSGGGTMVIRNSIVWASGSGPVGPSVIATDSTIEGGHTGPGNGNIAVDPQLGADLRLMAGSPAIDAGNTLVLLGDDPRDFDDNPRAIDDPATPDTGRPVYGLTADMGAFEFVPAGVTPTCTGDVNGDNSVDFNDLLGVLSAFGACP